MHPCPQGAGPRNAWATYQHPSPLEHANTHVKHTYRHTWTNSYATQHLCAYTYTCVNPQINVHKPLNVYTQMCTLFYRYMHTWEHVCAHTWTLIYAIFLCVHTCTCAYTFSFREVRGSPWCDDQKVHWHSFCDNIGGATVAMSIFVIWCVDKIPEHRYVSVLNKRNFICLVKLL